MVIFLVNDILWFEGGFSTNWAGVVTDASAEICPVQALCGIASRLKVFLTRNIQLEQLEGRAEYPRGTLFQAFKTVLTP